MKAGNNNIEYIDINLIKNPFQPRTVYGRSIK